jgi:hypothetical protein
MEIRRYQQGEEGAIWQVYFAATRESVACDYHADLIDRWAPHDHDVNKWKDRLVQKNPFVGLGYCMTSISFAPMDVAPTLVQSGDLENQSTPRD